MAVGEGLRGVVPAAGEGTRLRPLTDDRPKPLVEVAARPLLAHVLDALVGLGVDEVVVVVGHRGDEVAEAFGDDHRGTPLRYARQAEPLGLADAVLAAAPHLDATFVVVHGDNVLDADLGLLVERHRVTGADATLLVDDVPEAAAAGSSVLAFDGAGRLAGVVEQPDEPPSTTVVRGAYVLEPVALDACRAIEPSGRGEYEMAAAFDRLLDGDRRVETVPLEGACVNVNRPEDVERAERLLAG